MKIAVKGANSAWVIDNIVNDYRKYSRHKIVGINENPDVFWCADLFSFPAFIDATPKSCVPIVHIHHINENQLEAYNFEAFNKGYACIVYNEKSEKVAMKYLRIPIYRLPYWILSSNLVPKNDDLVAELKREIVKADEVLIGSFIKDGNGVSGSTPKATKNPDMFIEILRKLRESINVKAVLAGYARQYTINALSKLKIPFIYKERYKDIPTLYDCLDWYLVTSKCEGGPQSVLEASYRKIKILSTDVGVAPEILHSDCICATADEFVRKIKQNVDKKEYNYNNVVKGYMPKDVIPKWDNFFQGICEDWKVNRGK